MTTASDVSQVEIRPYRAGDEAVQAEIYNAATSHMPGFKPATADEVARRYGAGNFDPETKLYAERDSRVVGYIAFWANGRMSVPWSGTGEEAVRELLLEAALRAMRQRGIRLAWAAYRADWNLVRSWLESHGFRPGREMLNFVAAVGQLPREPVGPLYRIEPLSRNEIEGVYALDPGAFGVASPEELAAAWCDGPYLSDESVFVLRDASNGQLAAAGLAVADRAYADPTQVDARMPCFWLGAIGTEAERTKRINGLFSYVAGPDAGNHGRASALLSEACRRFDQVGVKHVAAQCRSDRPVEGEFYERYFQRQPSFPVFVREL